MDTTITEQAIALWLEHQREKLAEHFSFPVISLGVNAFSHGKVEFSANVGQVNTPSHKAAFGNSPSEAVANAIRASISTLETIA